MKYQFQNGEIIELHYKQKGATLFDSYDSESLAKLTELSGLRVVAAHDTTYKGEDSTLKNPRTLLITTEANPPFEFWLMDCRMTAGAVVEVLEDEPQPKEIAPRRKTIEDVIQLQREEAEAKALQEEIAAEMEREKKSG